MAVELQSTDALWDNAIQNKLFTTGGYNFQLSDGTVLTNGKFEQFDSCVVFDDDTDARFKHRFKARVNLGQYVRTRMRWAIPAPGLCVAAAPLETLFESNETLSVLYLYEDRKSAEPWPMFRYVRHAMDYAIGTTYIPIGDHAYLYTGDVINRRCDTIRPYDRFRDPVTVFAREDYFGTEEQFLRVYGTKDVPA